MKKTIENCRLIKRAIRIGIGSPEIRNNLCMGYSHGQDDDEPHPLCQQCKISGIENDK